MSIDAAKGKFQEAMLALRSMDDRGLFHMNEGLVLLCGSLKKIDDRLADLDEKIGKVSRQAGPKKKK